ncbi:class I adenylate-forming enzyme family protein [Streptomyces sp. Z26]|uniref:class I adenylate-forming enzyme family protein n=1 Tax=Streptomyces sp. Z26 TaxID=2500177 RepID=UPI000EF1685B|nr:class I adenylate-forming enzyme family protein [Streptomyces sp. Z26]RLL67618.1 long-chain fatty acid--CoA ligase [Streptomyces sp. Z26]
MSVILPDLLPSELRRAWAVEGTCPDLDIYSLYRAHRVADPHRIAVIDAEGQICYAALDRQVRCLAAGLAKLGVRAGDVVGIQLPNGRHAVIADLALAALGAVALPFPVGRGGLEAASLLRRSEAVAVIAAVAYRSNTHAADLVDRRAELPLLRAVIAAGDAPPGSIGLAALLRTDPGDLVPARPDPDSAARILVSSGSEAEPKMVAYSHNALAGGRGNFLASLMPGGRPPRCLFLVPLASAFGSNGTAVALARHGGTLVLLDHFTPQSALEALASHVPTHVLGVPTMVRMILDRLAENPGTELSPPTALVVGGSPLDQATAAEARDVFGCPVVNLYGSADGVNCHTGLAEPGAGSEDKGTLAGRPDPRVADIRITVPGTEPLVYVSPGAVGEIVARGPMTPLCYVAAPDLDARYRTDGGWVRTGDLGVIGEDGALRVVGRLKDVIVRGGANISPAEVELELAAHPRVRDVVCVGVADALMGERLAACVVPREDTAPTLRDLCDHLDARGLERRKHPEHLLTLSALPLTPAGKPDRTALREQFADQPQSVPGPLPASPR